MPSLVELGSVVLEKMIFFNFVNVFLLFRSYIHLEKDRGLYLNIKLEFPLPKGLLCRTGEFEVLIVRYAISRHVA